MVSEVLTRELPVVEESGGEQNILIALHLHLPDSLFAVSARHAVPGAALGFDGSGQAKLWGSRLLKSAAVVAGLWFAGEVGFRMGRDAILAAASSPQHMADSGETNPPALPPAAAPFRAPIEERAALASAPPLQAPAPATGPAVFGLKD